MGGENRGRTIGADDCNLGNVPRRKASARVADSTSALIRCVGAGISGAIVENNADWVLIGEWWLLSPLPLYLVFSTFEKNERLPERSESSRTSP
jgi:hypothetical protein